MGRWRERERVCRWLGGGRGSVGGWVGGGERERVCRWVEGKGEGERGCAMAHYQNQLE